MNAWTSRADLSQIHPLKRVTLIVLRFMFAVSLGFALATQFVWVSASLDSPQGRFTTTFDRWGLELMAGSPHGASTNFEFQCSYYGDFERIVPKYPVAQVRKADPGWVADFYPVPGLVFHTVRNRFFAAWIVVINPLWLISTSAVLYFFTHWRICRTARLQSLPS